MHDELYINVYVTFIMGLGGAAAICFIFCLIAFVGSLSIFIQSVIGGCICNVWLFVFGLLGLGSTLSGMIIIMYNSDCFCDCCYYDCPKCSNCSSCTSYSCCE